LLFEAIVPAVALSEAPRVTDHFRIQGKSAELYCDLTMMISFAAGGVRIEPKRIAQNLVEYGVRKK
jgi:hypothetical protein